MNVGTDRLAFADDGDPVVLEDEFGHFVYLSASLGAGTSSFSYIQFKALVLDI